ncbi:MAG: hypothetical protein ACI31I_01425 [Bacilli bacterium]
MAKKTLEEKELALKERERTINALEQKFKEQEAKIKQAHEDFLKEKEEFITEKDKDIVSKKVEYEKLVIRINEREKEFQRLLSDIEDLKRNKEVELSDFESKKLQSIEKKYRDLMEQNIALIQKSYNEQNSSLTNSIKWNSEELDKSFKKLLEEYEKELQSKQAIVDARLKALNESIVKLEEEAAKYSNLEEREQKLQMSNRLLEGREKRLNSLIDNEVKQRHSELLSDVKKFEALYNEYFEKFTDLSIRNEELMNSMSNSDNLDKARLESELNETKERLVELTKKYGKYNDDVFVEIKTKADRYDSLLNNYELVLKKKKELEEQIIKLQSASSNSDALKYENDILMEQIRVERSYFESLKDQVDQLEAKLTDSKNRISAAKTIETPYDRFINLDQDESQSKSEIEWLENIILKCKESGYVFSKRLFYSFHTCIKTSDMSPLTVLAGVSGTGKSKLPQLYSKFGGLYFLAIPVQPDWDSPQSLFGYYNSIEKRFNATTLLRALVSFQANKSFSETKENIYDLSNNVLIVLLDEMNLAHIELYFADLLSKLEEKRGEKDCVSFEVDLGASNEKYKIILTDNVKWIGTMNEDETTKSLSDKVIDRGNVISFPRPESFVRYHTDKPTDPAPKLKRCVWEKWITEKVSLTDEEADEYMSIITGINNEMKTVNRALGHRVWQSIENYMISHPLVYKYKDNKDKRAKALKYAFEEAIVQKVMTKLRGIETNGSQGECLEHIRDILQKNEFRVLIDDFNNAMNSVTGTFVWDSAKYLSEEYNLE